MCTFFKLTFFFGNSNYIKIEIHFKKKSLAFKQAGILNSINWLNSVVFCSFLPLKAGFSVWTQPAYAEFLEFHILAC